MADWSVQQSRRKQEAKRAICSYYAEGVLCPHGTECTSRHDARYKQKLCVPKPGATQHCGKPSRECDYAHGAHELRCWHSAGCLKRETCKYWHPKMYQPHSE